MKDCAVGKCGRRLTVSLSLQGVLRELGPLLVRTEPAPPPHRGSLHSAAAAGLAHAHRRPHGAAPLHEQVHLSDRSRIPPQGPPKPHAARSSPTQSGKRRDVCFSFQGRQVRGTSICFNIFLSRSAFKIANIHYC